MVKDSDIAPILEELHRDEKRIYKDEKLVKVMFIVIVILILIIGGAVSYLFIKSSSEKKTIKTIINEVIREPNPNIVTPTPTPSPIPTPSPTPTPTPTPAQKTSAAKDYYVNIGSGSNTSADWKDVEGAITTADIGQYQNIKEVSLEASINVPTANGTVSVRLYNKTDKHPVWNSEVTKNSTSDDYIFISPALNYDTGPKLYQVQMKSQLGVKANLVYSRLHIVTK
ncbi:hypothetical protein C4577_07055 [Candidatus Parcubacteria bacterium]|nr:MAG: hypothetical protein C4577_07055 [Candidatus Parcubacteria bacterium]